MKKLKLWRTPEARNKVVGIALGLLVGVIAGLLPHPKAGDLPVIGVAHELLKSFEHKAYDQRFRTRGPLPEEKVSRDIVLLDIDDDSYEWQTWPFDRTIWSEIVTALGAEGAGAKMVLFDVFFFDRSGPALNPGVADTFSKKFETLASIVPEETEWDQNVKMKLYEIADRLTGPVEEKDIKEIVAELDAIAGDPRFARFSEAYNDAALYLFENSALESLAPDRDAILADSIQKAGNVLLGQLANKEEDTVYDREDILFVPDVRAMFLKFIGMTDRTQTDNQAEVELNKALRNLRPSDFEWLLEKSDEKQSGARKPIPFSDKEKELIMAELAKVRAQTDYGMGVNERFRAKISPDNPVSAKSVLDEYIDVVQFQTVMPMFGDGSAGVGYVLPELQKDGVIRMMSPALNFDDTLYFHISFIAAMHYLGVGNDDLDFYPDKIVIRNAAFPESEKKTAITIPLDEKGTMLVNWAGAFLQPNTFIHRSVRKIYEDAVKYNILKKSEAGEPLAQHESEILQGLNDGEIKRVTEEIDFFRDKVILIGLTAAGTHDLNPVPFNPRDPLVGMHANAVNTIIKGLFIRRAPFWAMFAAVVALSAMVGFVGGTSKQSVGGAVAAGAIIVYAAVTQYLFGGAMIWTPLVSVVAAVVSSYLLVVVYRYMTEGKEAKKMKSMFSTYVNPEVVETLIHHPEKLRLGGEKMDLTAMFAMAYGPGLSDAESPEELVDRLNEYFTAMTEKIFANQGMLDKYEGAIIMAVYGAPVHYEDNAVKACYAALDMVKANDELLKKWEQEGKKPIRTMVGLNSGLMIAGNMGSESRFNYTIMGDAVNLSARLLGANKQYGSNLMISEFTLEKAKDFVIVRMLDKMRVVGKLEPVKVYELLGRTDVGLPQDVAECAKRFAEAYELYLEMKWDEAKAGFQRAMDARPGDGPSKVYMARCDDYKATPPPVGEDGKWDGVYVMTKK
jgi:adenylate cyclase